ncbi:DOMON-like domain-containing protein [uncultured Phenylobacterium sp.]|uniref:DOMON-like domain-containing protein n=1 Tax=uncultured Phenylobacterium sp. TaxID=349273 RepID=UPI0025E89378|nr:DOMON-like domain-containing protein [uncultured Phenylobacterium sp.]
MPALQRHPDFPCAALSGIEVDVGRSARGQLALRYRLSGVTDALMLTSGPAVRTDELWRHTCLEAFIQAAPDASYRELNLAPGGAWAAYRFDGYRAGMANAEVDPPQVWASAANDITVAWMLDLPADRPWRIGACAVIEEVGGRLSYWALAHPPGKPDFHHPDGFGLQLPAPEAP